MNRKLNKKGFTIVELVIVIAVVAILAAVLIPTFVGLVNDANVAKDTQLVRNLNTALASDQKAHVTMTDALDAAAAFGYDVAKINASATNNEILWDAKNDVFCYLNAGKIEYIPETSLKNGAAAGGDLWVISKTVSDTYSTYLYGFEGTEVEAKFGLDVGAHKDINVTYASAGNVAIRTNGGTLTVNNEGADVAHYGESEIVNILAVKGSSYHEFGKAEFTKLVKGHYVVESTGSTNALVIVDTGAASAENKGGEIVASYENKTEAEIADIQLGATLFAGGLGTADAPYLIENAEQLMNVSEKYNTYSYFKVKDGVKTIDCIDWSKNVNLNGSFDGNGVQLVNLTAALFNKVGFENTVQDITIKNFDVTVNSTTALVHNLFNGGTTTFENIAMSGYIEAQYNIGSFFRYGTANFNDTGCSYTVNFVDCQSDVIIVETTGEVPGGLFGHAYCGAGNVATINIDEKTFFTGALYTKATTAHYFGAIVPAGSVVYVNGEDMTAKNKELGALVYNKLTVQNPAKAEDGSYEIAKLGGVTSMAVSVNIQISAYDAEGNKIANSAGITSVASKTTLTELADVTKVLDAFTSVDLLTGKDAYSTEIVDGVLKINTTKSAEYTYDGNVTLQVTQYDANGNIVSVGSLKIATIDK